MRKLSKKKIEFIRRLFIYFAMTTTIIVSVILVTFIVLGFRLDIDNGGIEQYSFLQFSSTPSGATVTVDGITVSAKTPNKTTVKPGEHVVVMQKEGYETWTKTVNLKSGTLKWLNYTLFVPKKLTIETIATYAEINFTLASPKGRSVLIQKRSDTPTYELVDLGSDATKTSILVIPTEVFSESQNADIVHKFESKNWDDGGRYVLVKHTYGENYEWLVLDTQNANQTKNITRTFDIVISEIDFSGTSGNLFFAIEANDIRKLDLSAGTISKVLVSNVISISAYEANIITYIGNGDTADKRVIGLYRDGDETPHVIKTISGSKDVPLRVKTTQYFNEDYLVYSEGNIVNILGGSYPNTVSDSATSLKTIASFTIPGDIVDLDFSITGQYILAQSKTSFSSYDLEYRTMSSSTISCTDSNIPFDWLDENYVWSTCGGSLTIREFDGKNVHTINAALPNQSAILTHNGRFLYSFNKSDAGYQLQRVRMILP